MNVLDQICARKREHVEERRRETPLAALRERVLAQAPARGFRRNIAAFHAAGKTAIIAEIKKASPSGGVIRPDFDPAKLAAAYEAGGAACLSVLTDQPYFQGRDSDLQAARQACALPVLRKDFMVDEYQIYESRALGADCVLLIMAALDDGAARALHDCARGLGLDVLVEVHDRAEMDRALNLGARMIGVNSRNLKTLKVDLETAHSLASSLPADVIGVAESGISGPADRARLETSGYQTFLVGESLMRQPDVALALRDLLRVDN